MFEIIISGVLGLLLGYFSSYVKEKAKNKALKEDIEILEEQKRSIEAKYNVEQERVKFVYARKIDCYETFCEELDQFQIKGEELLNDKALPMIQNFLESIRKNGVDTAFSEYAVEMIKICNEINSSYIKIKNKSNKTKLMVSDETFEIINYLMDVLKHSTESTSKLLQFYASKESLTNAEKGGVLSKELQEISRNIDITIEKMISQMRLELNTVTY